MDITEQKFRNLSRILAAIVCAGGLTIIAGWQFRIPVLRGELFDTFVAPNTALLMVVCGASILMQTSSWKFVRWVGAALGFPILIFASAVWLEHLLHVDYGIDKLFMAHRLSDWGLPEVGRFSLTTSVNFILAGFSLATLLLPIRRAVSEFFAACIGMVCYFGVVGYLYRAKLLYGQITSFYTIVMFIVLAVSLICAAPELRFARFLTGNLAGGIVARRVVAAIVVLLPLLGWLEVQGRRRELFPREAGVAFFVVAAATIFTLLVLRTARLLNEIDRRRSQAEHGLVQTEKLAATGRMAATIAHEINNPLGVVTNLLYLCRTMEMDNKTRDSYLAMAEEEVRHLAMISKQTLGFYRESADPIEIDCNEIVTQVISLYRARLANKGIRVTQNLEADRKIYAVVGELRQVLVNLVANAFDACPAVNGFICFSSSMEGNMVVLDVSDNGSGIDPANHDKIFEAFFTTKESFGTGLGLWVSKGLIEKNGGKIEVISKDLPFRTTFRLRLPAAKAAYKVAIA